MVGRKLLVKVELHSAEQAKVINITHGVTTKLSTDTKMYFVPKQTNGNKILLKGSKYTKVRGS